MVLTRESFLTLCTMFLFCKARIYGMKDGVTSARREYCKGLRRIRGHNEKRSAAHEEAGGCVRDLRIPYPHQHLPFW
jgi:hypothetical protein